MENIIKENINQIKNEINYQLDNYPISEILKIINRISNVKGNIFICGVGKCEILAKLISSLLKSINISAFTLSVLNLNHGDVGALNMEKDLLIILSKSGNTEELINLCKIYKNINKYGIFCNKNANLKKYCDSYLILPFNNELKNGINIMPTNSNSSFTIIFNLIISGLIYQKKITLDKYKKNHLCGNIGKQLKSIKNIMNKDFPLVNLEEGLEINYILLKMAIKRQGCCIFINNKGDFMGLMTDCDFRNYFLINNLNIETFINKACYCVTDKNLKIVNIYDKIKEFAYIPVIENNKPIGIIDRTTII